MYFIIIPSINFDCLLSVNRVFDKDTKQGIFIVIFYCKLKQNLLIKVLLNI